jgi:NADH:flavin oxidoreductases, Old Yellow Enzyme family
VPVVGVGRFTDPDEMARVVRSGQYDIIGCARPSIADPWLPRKIDEGRLDDIAECIGCNQCIARFEYGVQIVCTQNPTALEEYRRGWHPEVFAPRSADELVMVVGAGPAGLECARVLARRGYRVHLVEAEAQLGGHLRHVAELPGLAEWARVISLRETQLARMVDVEIIRGAGVVEAEHLLDYGAAKIVLATGAAWVGDGVSSSGPDPVPGIDATRPEFVTPEQLWAGKPVGKRVAILDADGYFMAVSLAEKLADAGRQVTLVTPFDKVAPLYRLHAGRAQPAPHDAPKGNCRADGKLDRTGGSGTPADALRHLPRWLSAIGCPGPGSAAAARRHGGRGARGRHSPPLYQPALGGFALPGAACSRGRMGGARHPRRLSSWRLPRPALYRRCRLRRPSPGAGDRLARSAAASRHHPRAADLGHGRLSRARRTDAMKQARRPSSPRVPGGWLTLRGEP